MISIWLGSSGLLEHIPATIPNEWKHKWIEIYNSQKYTMKKVNLDWKLFRIRPVNHPVVRLLQITELVFSSLDNSLFNHLLNSSLVTEYLNIQR